MTTPSTLEILEQLDKVFKDKPNYKKLSGGSGYRNGYEDGYKLAVKRFKALRDEVVKNSQNIQPEAPAK